MAFHPLALESAFEITDFSAFSAMSFLLSPIQSFLFFDLTLLSLAVSHHLPSFLNSDSSYILSTDLDFSPTRPFTLSATLIPLHSSRQRTNVASVLSGKTQTATEGDWYSNIALLSRAIASANAQPELSLKRFDHDDENEERFNLKREIESSMKDDDSEYLFAVLRS